ncbi:AbiV family abortive infection protein [Bacillus wiedmannii]|uniref:AbiV family abortive infection protein n=1 Tax=Bacillus wiedmannii TaxID=1890302 RepID=UPI003D9634AB
MAKKLTVDEVEKMRLKVIENASELIEDAKLLLENKRYARAYTLSHLMCEELSKIPMICRALTESAMDKNYKWKDLHKRLVNHNPKIRLFMMMPTVNVKGLEKIVDIPVSQGIKAFEKTLNNLKNNSLYSGFQGDDFKKPSEVITKEIAETMFEIASEYFMFMEVTEGKLRGTTHKSVGEDFIVYFSGLKEMIEQNPETIELLTLFMEESYEWIKECQKKKES